MSQSTVSLDESKAEAFAGKMIEMFNGAAMSLMVSIGHRTGLFDAMDGLPATDISGIAKAAGLNERYVREWLGAMYTGGVVEHDPGLGTYWLPAEHARWLTRDASPENLAVTGQWISVLASVECDVVDAFDHGNGVPYEAYHRFHEVMAEESEQTVVAALEPFILPLVPGLTDRLEAGIDVVDIGCGSGRAIIRLAERYPASRFSGYDMSNEAVAIARAEVEGRGLANVAFRVMDAAAITDTEAFDLVFTFDAVHDQASPDRVLSNIHRALRPGGTYLCQDIKAHTHHHGNTDHSLAPFLYTISCMHCMSVSLANGGPGLGACWGKQKALQMFDAAGFEEIDVKELDHDMMNYFYLMNK